MRTTICTLSLAALLGSGGLYAQSTTQPRPDSTPSALEEIKLTGCLKQAPPSGGTGSAGSSATKFVLEVMAPHAGMPSQARKPETSPQTPDQTTRSTATKKETYDLMAMGSVDLSKHVNHVVELTGTKAKMSGATNPPAASPTGSPSTTSSADERPMFHVTALRMVSTNCNQTSQ